MAERGINASFTIGPAFGSRRGDMSEIRRLAIDVASDAGQRDNAAATPSCAATA